MTEQVQSLSRRTIQQLASISKVELNSTFSLALVFSVSAGSGNALPTDSCFTPFLQQTLSTLMVPSLLRPQVAQVFSQFLSKQQGITACSYHAPRYLFTSTKGTVFGGSWVKLVSASIERLESCHPAIAKSRGTMIRSDLFILFFQIQSDIPNTYSYITKNDRKNAIGSQKSFLMTQRQKLYGKLLRMQREHECFLCWIKENYFHVRQKLKDLG